MSSEYFRNKPNDPNDVGIASSLQDLNRGIISTLDTQLDDDDDDELGNTLTKCLAETAVAVRDMSKQLGMLIGLNLCHCCADDLHRSSPHPGNYPDRSYCHEGP
jgi:hypothetical protein